MILVPSYYTSS